MKIKSMREKVLSIEQMEYLKELGLDTSNASMYYLRFKDEPDSLPELACCRLSYILAHITDDEEEIIPTYTLQDLLDVIPEEITVTVELSKGSTMCPEEGMSLYDEDVTCTRIIKPKYIDYHCNYPGQCCYIHSEDIIDGDILTACYNMLVWCIKKGYIKK